MALQCRSGVMYIAIPEKHRHRHRKNFHASTGHEVIFFGTFLATAPCKEDASSNRYRQHHHKHGIIQPMERRHCAEGPGIFHEISFPGRKLLYIISQFHIFQPLLRHLSAPDISAL